jgi:hypothetical protein
MNHAQAFPHLRFGREPFASLAGDFKIGFVRDVTVVCHTASVLRVAVDSSRHATRRKVDGQENAVELLLSEAALPLSYAGIWNRRLDSNQQPTITHNFGPSEMRKVSGQEAMVDVDCCSIRLSYFHRSRRADLNRQPTVPITHNLRPAKKATDKRRTGNTCSTTELLRHLVPEAGLEPATTSL